MGGHAIGTHEAALRLALGVDELPDVRSDLSLAMSRPFRGARILDLASGPNPFPWVAGGPEYIAERGIKVTCDLPGVEGPAERPDLWRDRHVEADLNTLRYFDDKAVDITGGSGEFDLIVALEIVEHVENPWRLLRLIDWFLADDGVAIISSPDVTSARARKLFEESGRFPWFPDWPNDIGHISPIFPYIFREMARRANLRVTGEAFNEPPPHWREQATDEEIAGVADSVRIWRLAR